MSLLDNAKQAVVNAKKALYDVGGALCDLKKADNIIELAGLRFGDCVTNACKLDKPLGTMLMKVAERFAFDQVVDQPLSEWKKMVSDKEPKAPSDDKFITIKLDKHAGIVFDEAYHKFCNQNQLDPSVSKSFFIETRCAEFLAEVDIDGVVEDFPIEANHDTQVQL